MVLTGKKPSRDILFGRCFLSQCKSNQSAVSSTIPQKEILQQYHRFAKKGVSKMDDFIISKVKI